MQDWEWRLPGPAGPTKPEPAELVRRPQDSHLGERELELEREAKEGQEYRSKDLVARSTDLVTRSPDLDDDDDFLIEGHPEWHL